MFSPPGREQDVAGVHRGQVRAAPVLLQLEPHLLRVVVAVAAAVTTAQHGGGPQDVQHAAESEHHQTHHEPAPVGCQRLLAIQVRHERKLQQAGHSDGQQLRVGREGRVRAGLWERTVWRGRVRQPHVIVGFLVNSGTPGHSVLLRRRRRRRSSATAPALAAPSTARARLDHDQIQVLLVGLLRRLRRARPAAANAEVEVVAAQVNVRMRAAAATRSVQAVALLVLGAALHVAVHEDHVGRHPDCLQHAGAVLPHSGEKHSTAQHSVPERTRQR